METAFRKPTWKPTESNISKQLDIKLGPFTKELNLVLRKIKNRKAAGLDEIPPEVWKTRQFNDILLQQCNAVYNQNMIDRWMKGCILPFPKKGDLGLAKNYRGMTLTSIADKIYNALLRNRIEPKIDNILDYVLRTSIDKIRENGIELTKKRSRRYPAKTITNADYTDDIALLANTPNQAETLLHSLGLHVNAHKSEYMCYNQTGDISTLDRTSLKLVDKFTYLGSSVSSTEKDIDTWLTKA